MGAEGPIATNKSVECKARMCIIPCSSCIVMAFNSSLSADLLVAIDARDKEEEIRVGSLDGYGWYRDQRETASVACVRRVEAGKCEELERSLPLGESRIRVWRWGEVDWERKAERRLVRSMVWDMVVVGVGT